MNTRKLSWLVFGVAALCAVAAGIWPRISAWRSSTASVTAPAAGELALQGKLARNWNGEVTDDCDFLFQLWDADVNGAPTGAAVEVDNVAVRQGAFGLSMPAAKLGEAGMSSWLSVGVRCGGEAQWETLTPRMQHQAIALAGAVAAGFPVSDAEALVCSMPTTDAAGVEHEPVISGVNYRLQGGFRTATAGGGAP